MKTNILLLYLAIVWAWCIPCMNIVNAKNMESNRFQIQGGTIDIGGRDQSSSSFKLSTSVGQAVANQLSSSGFIVKAGFQYLYSIIPFTFRVSNRTISLGSLMPGTPSTGTTNLTVSFGGAGQYQVTVRADDQLRTLGAIEISDTSCNGGADTCTATTAKLWNSTGAYGFGYSMSGEDIPADFISTSYFRPFNQLSESEVPVVVMSNTNVTIDGSSTPRNTNTSTMTYKVNIGNVQPAGSYQTIVRYIATPSY